METQSQGERFGGEGGKRHVAADLQDSKPPEHHMIPVWFFVGVILLIYGVIILGTGICEYSSPPPTVLSNTHPAIWWGALLTVIGGIYTYIHFPKKA
jgi:hypothetical protein